MKRQVLRSALVIGLVIATAGTAAACPFCAAVSKTFSEEIESMDAVVIAKLTQPPPPQTEDLQDEVPRAKFQITKIVKGGDHVQSKVIEAIYFGQAKAGAKFLLMGVDPPKMMWSSPLPLTAKAESYIQILGKLPKVGVERLKFFQNFLEDEDELLARDAFDEFAKADYAIVKQLKPNMNHKQIINWIQNGDIPASRRRLYFTMLGVCGTSKDLSLLESLLKSKDRKKKSGLDALIACYLTLRGPDGMPLIEDLFLKNKSADYADTYAAIMALRFHGKEADIVPRKRVLAGLRHMLDRPELADLVIPDLARWKDWSQLERMAQLFKKADDKSSWVKVPVINYLRACPKPRAKVLLEELKKIDPAAVKRANTYFPQGAPAAAEKKAAT